MYTKDLRIGNFIKDTSSGRIGNVLSLTPFRIKCKMEKSTLHQHSDYFEAVKL